MGAGAHQHEGRSSHERRGRARGVLRARAARHSGAAAPRHRRLVARSESAGLGPDGLLAVVEHLGSEF
jgi:hypothetical protein